MKYEVTALWATGDKDSNRVLEFTMVDGAGFESHRYILEREMSEDQRAMYWALRGLQEAFVRIVMAKDGTP